MDTISLPLSTRKVTILTNMTSRTMLKYLLNINTLLGVHWNYCIRTKIQKYLIIFHTFVSLSVHTFVVFEEVYLAWTRETAEVIIYCAFAISAYFTLAPSFVTAIYRSHIFVSFLDSTDRLAAFFKDERKVVKPINVTYWSTIIITIVTVACAILKTIDFTIVFTNRGGAFVFFVIMTQVILRTTIAFQYITFFVAIALVVKYTKRLTESIKRVERIARCYDMDVEDKNMIKKEIIQEWAQVYLDLANCCEKVSLCFGRQVICKQNNCHTQRHT